MTTKTKAIPTNAVNEAEQHVQRLQEEKTKAGEMLALLQAELAELEAGMGDELLTAKLADPKDSKTADAITLRVSTARAAVTSAEAMLAAIGPRIQEAERAVWAAKAVELRDQAATMFKDVQKRIEKAETLLNSLAELEGQRFLPFPWVQPSGVVLHGSWSRTKTGDAIAELCEIEAEAARAEAHARVSSPDSVLRGIELVGLLLGNPGQVGPMPEMPEQEYAARARLLDHNAPGLLGYRS